MKLLAIAATLLLAGQAAAQQSVRELQPEQRVRIFAPDAGMMSPRTGVVIEARADSILLQMNGTQRSIAVADVRTLEVSQGKDSRGRWARRGAEIGTTTGVAAAIFWKITFDEGEPHSEVRCVKLGAVPQPVCDLYHVPARKFPIARYPVAVATGIGIGAFIGWLVPSDRWRSVPMAPAVTAMPTAGGGVALGATLRIR